jgi:hydrogenase nickel incorporation protein HypA/HybF
VRPVRVGLKIGEMAAVDEDALTFCFDAVVKGTEYDGLTLAIRMVKPRRTCTACATEFDVVDYNSLCTACGSGDTKAISGDELDFEFLEVETE